jgi:hypothetical protein
MGVMIVAATVLLVVLVIQRGGKAVQGVAVNTELALRQPAGSRIAGIATLDGQLAVWVDRPDGGRVLLLDPRGLRQMGEIRLGD